LLTTERERAICKKYSAVDENGRVRCSECPLSYKYFDMPFMTCKAIMHYNRHTRKWEPDEENEENGKAE